ncbi:MAG TPA: hypothetical protein VF721_08285 [Pyrinomonadaceae bacterium]|jgi:hypothetical protein
MGKEQIVDNNKTQTTLSAEAVDSHELKKVIFNEIRAGAEPIAKTLNIENLYAVNEGFLGDFPWFHHIGLNTNAKTYNWVNNVFDYNKDNYIETNAGAFTTSYFNVLQDTQYVLSAEDQMKLNAVVGANQVVVNTLITDFVTTQGPIPSPQNKTLSSQLLYVMTEILTWGVPGLTLAQLQNSTNPMSLLPNIPLGAGAIINDLMTYLGNSSSVAGIQGAVTSNNAQLAQTKSNISPAPADLSPGWIQIVDGSGNTSIAPEIDFQESVANIQNELLPRAGKGRTFSVEFLATKLDSNQVQVSNSSSSGTGFIGFLFGASNSSGTSYNMFSFAENLTSCEVKLEFNGVTKVTPSPFPYNISSAAGWWNPAPVKDAANPSNPPQSGYQFSTKPQFDFQTNGDFGFLSTIMISQQPIIKLTYKNASLSQFQQVFTQRKTWGTSFLGIPLAGGSNSSYTATASESQDGTSVVVTMSPVENISPVSIQDNLAYVIGAEVFWMGAAS